MASCPPTSARCAPTCPTMALQARPGLSAVPPRRSGSTTSPARSSAPPTRPRPPGTSSPSITSPGSRAFRAATLTTRSTQLVGAAPRTALRLLKAPSKFSLPAPADPLGAAAQPAVHWTSEILMKLSSALVALTLALPASAWAQTQITIQDDFTQAAAQNNWVTYDGACLTAGNGSGTVPACVGLAYYATQGAQAWVGGATGTL